MNIELETRSTIMSSREANVLADSMRSDGHVVTVKRRKHSSMYYIVAKKIVKVEVAVSTA